MMLQGCLLLSHKSICHNFISPYQKQQFADVIQNRYFQKFHNVHRKAIVLEPPFNKVAGLQDRFISMNIAKFLRTAFIYRTPLMAAFVPFLPPPTPWHRMQIEHYKTFRTWTSSESLLCTVNLRLLFKMFCCLL